jgi:demethylmenaquinone methyltransferase/2-methoxy-6-polyprenyl-1,4-benzoquinol methylase
MFARVAPRYDFLNHLLSLNIDRLWRKRLAQAVAPALRTKGSSVLDLCCGTGDVVIELQKRTPALVVGADFCHPMLAAAREKSAAVLIECDALCMPLRNASTDAITIAFGFRNLANYEAGLAEFQRLLKPGGMLAILEFSHPRAWPLRLSYAAYFNLLLPLIATLFSGSFDAYKYLPDSVRRFPAAEELRDMMTQAGFENTRFALLSGGIAALHTGFKPAKH